ncbi:MAG: glycosyltransferase [Gammaproteobacteria bacterium]|nr:glycosyltransferase [Gammaproteobacteria bacterium]
MLDILNKFDAVIMLTWSDWKTELRSNRYHYASRFCKFLPVIFVQPDLLTEKYYYEKTELANVFILHVSRKFSQKQSFILNQALRAKNIIKPLVWVYNCRFSKVIANLWSPLVVYHATEDYFCHSPHQITSASILYPDMMDTLQQVDLLVSVSAGVEKSFIEQGKYAGKHITITNGCDFKFYYEKRLSLTENSNNIILYQGNINSKLDYPLLLELATRMPEYEFWFCGKVSGNNSQWKDLIKKSNVKYFGTLNCDELKIKMYQAAVGIIPFQTSEYIEHSFPLKAFEYLACGLPVVSVPIESLQHYKDVFHFAVNVNEFELSIKAALISSRDKNLIESRQSVASEQDYDLKFSALCKSLASTLHQTEAAVTSNRPLEMLVLYDANSIHVSTISEHLRAFKKYSKNNIYYANATGNIDCYIDLSVFDVVVIHYSIRINTNNCDSSLSPHYIRALKNYGGFKALFIQDEYDTTNIAKTKMLDIGIHTVFTTVPKAYVDAVYPPAEFSHIDFIQTLTGYIPEHLNNLGDITPLHTRKMWIGYRGRDLPYWYGNLGREKFIIGKEMKRICSAKDIPIDIEWETDKRIYGDNWYKFLSSCRTTLGTESGSNVFDFTGEISRNIQLAMKQNPSVTYEEIFERFLCADEGKIVMNQISPKIFEAIALRTGLVLFEGSYSGIIEPDLHFIALKKDFSNFDEVLTKIGDDNYLQKMTTRSFDDVVKSGRFSYKAFINEIDIYFGTKVKSRSEASIIPILFAYANHSRWSHTNTSSKGSIQSSLLTNDLVNNPASLSIINKIGIKNYKGLPTKPFAHLLPRMLKGILASNLIIKPLIRVNNVLPGKPLTKVYSTIKRCLKI